MQEINADAQYEPASRINAYWHGDLVLSGNDNQIRLGSDQEPLKCMHRDWGKELPLNSDQPHIINEVFQATWHSGVNIECYVCLRSS